MMDRAHGDDKQRGGAAATASSTLGSINEGEDGRTADGKQDDATDGVGKNTNKFALQLLNPKLQDDAFQEYANSFRRVNRFFNWIHAVVTDMFQSELARSMYYYLRSLDTLLADAAIVYYQKVCRRLFRFLPIQVYGEAKYRDGDRWI